MCNILYHDNDIVTLSRVLLCCIMVDATIMQFQYSISDYRRGQGQRNKEKAKKKYQKLKTWMNVIIGRFRTEKSNFILYAFYNSYSII